MSQATRRTATTPRGYRLSPAKLVLRATSFGARSARLIRASTIGTARSNGFTINVVRDENDETHYFGVVLLD